jgi:uncharacterized protein (DUF2252 family)
MPLKSFAVSMRDYERWLRAALDGTLWEADLAEKHEKMRENPFVFLRATYWRWAETILTVCANLADAPIVPGIGDIHLENYGVWRDGDGRLVWGVNDLDEAAEMPYALDLVRLATSAILSRGGRRRGARRICADVLEGYRDGLARPSAFSLDEKHPSLRTLFVVSDDERARFWKKMKRLAADDGIPVTYRTALTRQMPGRDAVIEKFARRPGAGTGSLGRPRWVAVAKWHGGRVVREAKAIVPSAWTLAHGGSARQPAAPRIAAGRHRAADPWYVVTRRLVVRRLSPNARKIEVQDHPRELVDAEMLHAMGYELANLHLTDRNVRARIEKDLARRGARWLDEAAEAAAAFVRKDFAQYAP